MNLYVLLTIKSLTVCVNFVAQHIHGDFLLKSMYAVLFANEFPRADELETSLILSLFFNEH